MAIHIPRGTQEFNEAVKNLMEASEKNASWDEQEELAIVCCRLCTCRASHDDCDECSVGKLTERIDRYKARANSASLGMYTTGVFHRPNGKMTYTHNAGG